jgi:hypothetical protein
MSLAIILIGGWVLATGVVGVFAWSLGRDAAIGDRRDYGLVETGASVSDRRVGSPNRRDEARPWLAGSPGRRSEDVLRRDVGARALQETMAALTPAESYRR